MFHILKYISSFEAGNCVSNSCFKSMKNGNKQLSSTRLTILACAYKVKDASYINPLSPHDALKHHFTSMKTDLISVQLRILERKFP